MAPGATPYGDSNPGVCMFELSSSYEPQNLRFEFLDLDDTFGKSSVSYSDAKWWSVDYAS